MNETILTLEQIEKHFEHIEMMELVGDEIYSFWTHNVSLYRSDNTDHIVLLVNYYDTVDEEETIETFIFQPNTQFKITWRNHLSNAKMHRRTAEAYEELQAQLELLKSAILDNTSKDKKD